MNVISRRSQRQVVVELYRFLRTGDWKDATCKHLAALHGWCHYRTYGCWPSNYFETEFSIASLRAGRLARKACYGNASDIALYLKWLWLRERDRLKHTKARPIAGVPSLDSELVFKQGNLFEAFQQHLVQKVKQKELAIQRAAEDPFYQIPKEVFDAAI